MIRTPPIVALTVLHLTLLSAAWAAENRAPQGLTVGAEGGCLRALSLSGQQLALPAQGGGFRVFDATAQNAIALPPGTVTQAAGKTTFEVQGPDVRLHADFVLHDAFLLVSGYVENPRGDARGLIVDYRIPALGADAVFSNDLEEQLPLAQTKEYEGNVFPLAALCGKEAGLAVAIPPNEPRIFGMAADRSGMAARFYLGLSPETRRFKNRASFVFLVYPVEPAWGFRSALERYYSFFPEYYTPRLKRDGLFMFQMEDRVPANIDQYGFDLVESQWKPEVLQSAITRDKQQGIATFPYLIVGQREIKFLPKLPRNYDEAMAAFARWTVADQAGHAWTKENAASQGDIHLKEEVESSACKTRDGKYSLVIRNTPWGADSVSFKINPNPDLFKDLGRPNVASYAFELMHQWLQQHPEYAGMFVDSLGANWPALLNYRQEHFAYARFPLTFDPQGRVALQNDLSHYEYIDALRTWLRSSGRLVLANGVYAYKSKSATSKGAERQAVNRKLHEFVAESAPPEHYRAGTKLGRFFCASLFDVASSEAGVQANVERCRDVRVFMGKKHYAFLNYSWEDAAKVEEFVNKSLCYGIFASTSSNFFTGVHYEDHPQGYLRDKKLLDWYVPLVRKLSRAGWEPVRRGAVAPTEVSCERFGAGEVVYYTLYNDGKNKLACTLAVDLKSLGFAEPAAVFSEIARGTPLARPKPNAVALELEPKRAYVIQIAKESAR